MLEKGDFKEIRKVVREEVGGAIEKHIAPAFNDVYEQLDGVDKRLGAMDKRLTRVEALMVTKDYFDDKLGDLRGDIILLLRKDERRFLYLIDILYQKKILSEEDIKRIEDFQLFPRLVK